MMLASCVVTVLMGTTVAPPLSPLPLPYLHDLHPFKRRCRNVKLGVYIVPVFVLVTCIRYEFNQYVAYRSS